MFCTACDEVLDEFKSISPLAPLILIDDKAYCTKCIQFSIKDKDTTDALRFIRSAKDLLNPTTPRDVLELLKAAHRETDIKWILWNLAPALNNTHLLIRTFKHLFENERSISEDIAKKPGQLDLLLDHYVPMLGHGKIKIGTVIFDTVYDMILMINTIFLDYFDFISRGKSILVQFYEHLISMLYFFDISEQLVIFRFINENFSKCKKHMKKIYQNSLLFMLERHVHRDSLIHSQVVRFIYLHAPKNFPFDAYLTVLEGKGIKDHIDFVNFRHFFYNPRCHEQLHILNVILNIAVTNGVLSRLATSCFAKMLKLILGNTELMNYVELFLKRAIQYVYMVHGSEKYASNVELISEFFHTIQALEVPSFSKFLSSALGKLRFKKMCPDSMKGLKFRFSVKNEWLEEINQVDRERIDFDEYFTRVCAKLPIINDKKKPVPLNMDLARDYVQKEAFLTKELKGFQAIVSIV